MQDIGRLADMVQQYAVAYGFQILGAIVVLLIGLKVASLGGRWVRRVAVGRGIDVTLAKFFASLVQILLVGVVVVMTLANFGVAIAPIVALAGASAFGLTLALQGVLSNYAAGLSIILTRPFVVGNTIRVRGVEGVVDNVGLGTTILAGEDGERILVPNKEIVGAILVNSEAYRIVEARLFIDADQDVATAIAAAKQAILAAGADAGGPSPQVGVEDFGVGGVVLGARYWVPSKRYFERRYAINGAILKALEAAGIHLRLPPGAAFSAELSRPALRPAESVGAVEL
jgi:small conductance mechanosensitive channel